MSQTAILPNDIDIIQNKQQDSTTMDKVLAISTSFIGFLTPTNKRRRTITTTTHLSSEATPTNQAPSHAHPYMAASEPRRAQGAHAASRGQMSRNTISPDDAKLSSNRKRRHEDEGIEDYVESENSSAIGPEDSASNIMRYDDEETILTAPDSERGQRIGNGYKRQRVADYQYEYGSEEVDEEEDEVATESEVDSINLAPEDEQAIAEEEAPNEDISREELFARRRGNIEEAKAAGWHKDEIDIYAKLTMRGFEPLMPMYWWKDFRTCPSGLFSDNPEEWVICSRNGNEYRGIKSLTSLTTLGGRVRDALLFRQSPEQVMKKEYDACIKWTEKDGGYHKMRFIPLLVNLAVDRSQPVDRISKSIIDQMNYLAVRYRQFYACQPTNDQLTEKPLNNNHLNKSPRKSPIKESDGGNRSYSKELPLIYGIVAVGATTVFVTMDPADTESSPRTIAEFDFSDTQMDVWNGIAMAMIICFVRDKLVAIKEAGDMQPDDAEESDPDA